jgi:hypothetical protein
LQDALRGFINIASGMQLTEGGQASAHEQQLSILHLLSAHDLPAAAALASHSGHPHLATLVAAAGLHPHSTALLRQQITAPDGPAHACWQAAGMFGKEGSPISPPLEAVYKLLSGDVPAAFPQLGSPQLSWQRAFGLCLWFASPPDAAISETLQHFDSLVNNVDGGAAVPPAPLPAHLASASRLPSLPTTDAQYSLIQLCAGTLSASHFHGLAIRLANTRSFSQDGLDALIPWLALSLLRAVQALPSKVGTPTITQSPDSMDADNGWALIPVEATSSDAANGVGGCSDGVFRAATVACAEGLLLLGEPLWAVHVLLHLPAPTPEAAASKAETVRTCLEVHWPAIRRGGVDHAVHFLCVDSKLPRAWLAAAEAVMARREGDVETLVIALLEADQVEQAERVLFEEVAPSMMTRKQVVRLGHLVRLCGDTPATSQCRTLRV